MLHGISAISIIILLILILNYNCIPLKIIVHNLIIYYITITLFTIIVLQKINIYL